MLCGRSAPQSGTPLRQTPYNGRRSERHMFGRWTQQDPGLGGTGPPKSGARPCSAACDARFFARRMSSGIASHAPALLLPSGPSTRGGPERCRSSKCGSERADVAHAHRAQQSQVSAAAAVAAVGSELARVPLVRDRDVGGPTDLPAAAPHFGKAIGVTKDGADFCSALRNRQGWELAGKLRGGKL